MRPLATNLQHQDLHHLPLSSSLAAYIFSSRFSILEPELSSDSLVTMAVVTKMPSSGQKPSKDSVDRQPTARAPSEKPPFTLGELRKAIPPHCFERSALRSFQTVVADVAMLAALHVIGQVVDARAPFWLACLAWPLIWFAQVLLEIPAQFVKLVCRLHAAGSLVQPQFDPMLNAFCEVQIWAGRWSLKVLCIVPCYFADVFDPLIIVSWSPADDWVPSRNRNIPKLWVHSRVIQRVCCGLCRSAKVAYMNSSAF